MTKDDYDVYYLEEEEKLIRKLLAVILSYEFS